MNRRYLALAALAAMILLSGCSMFGGGGEISEDELTSEASYEWETNATASYNLTTSPLLSLSTDTFRAVIELDNQSTLEIHRERTFRGDTSVPIEALQFRFTNGTVVNAAHENLTAVQNADHTEIQLPAEYGTVAYTANWGGGSMGGYGRSWATPTYVRGSYEVTLPEGARVGLPLLSRARPGEYSSTVEDNRMTITWEEPEGAVAVRYYHTRDLFILGSLVATAILVGIGGTLYYYRQIQRAKRKRQEVGLDVEETDDHRREDGPPPGMR
jgi:hypothetical protein